jgi:hypothetical protein
VTYYREINIGVNVNRCPLINPRSKTRLQLYDTDCGTVRATNANYLTIKWDDGHQSFTGHSEMRRIEVKAPGRIKSR